MNALFLSESEGSLVSKVQAHFKLKAAFLAFKMGNPFLEQGKRDVPRTSLNTDHPNVTKRVLPSPRLCVSKTRTEEGDGRKSGGVPNQSSREPLRTAEEHTSLISCRTVGPSFSHHDLNLLKTAFACNRCLPATTSLELSTVVQIHSFQKNSGYVCKLCKISGLNL